MHSALFCPRSAAVVLASIQEAVVVHPVGPAMEHVVSILPVVAADPAVEIPCSLVVAGLLLAAAYSSTMNRRVLVKLAVLTHRTIALLRRRQLLRPCFRCLK